LLNNRAINAAKFVNALSICLDDYLDDLKKKTLDDDIWVNAKKKIRFICANCCACKQEQGLADDNVKPNATIKR